MAREVVVITGSNGFIGKHLVKSIYEKYKIIGLDRSEGTGAFDTEHITMDITSDKSVSDAFSEIRDKYGFKIASVIHLAAYYDFSGKPSPLYDKVTVKGTERLIKKLQEFEVEQFIFSSSMLVYKPTRPGKKINEDWPLEPKWDYPKSKVKTEKILHDKKGNIPVVNLRIAGAYNDEGSSIPIANHIQRVYEKQITAYFYPGDTSHGNAFVHLDDLINSMQKTIERRKELPAETVLNIGEEETLSFKEMQIIISKEIHGKEIPTIVIPKFLGKIGAYFQNMFGETFIKPWMIDIADDHYELDCTRAKELIGWKTRYSLRETLPKIISDLKKDPVSWYKKNKLKLPDKLKKDK